ncbi:MAG: phosphoglycerate kinase [Patescibacteria group bacterium]
MIASVVDLMVARRRVLVRVDWNVACDEAGTITDDFRIRASLPTIRLLRKKKAQKIILAAHFGNPVVRIGEGLERTIAGNRRLTFAVVAKHAAQLLHLPDINPKLVILPGSPLPAYELAPDLILLENLRFDSGELANDPKFGRALAALADCFVNEAFAEVHRSVASLSYPPQTLPSAIGLELADELSHLSLFVDKPPKPTVMVLGGAKVYDKAMLIDTLLKKIDTFLLGGVMANTFLAAQGVDLRRSLIERDRLEVVRGLLNRAPGKFILPIDFVWDRDRALDIGSQTVALYRRYLAKAKLIFWNGPMGWTASGRDRYFHGSEAMAESMSTSDATTIVAGGDTLAVVDRLHLEKKFSFRSTGGGATLAYLAGDELPGLVALERGKSKS